MIDFQWVKLAVNQIVLHRFFRLINKSPNRDFTGTNILYNTYIRGIV